MPFHFLFLWLFAVAGQHVGENVVHFAEEGIYGFPLSLGGELSIATGRCSVGNDTYERCFVKLHEYGFSIHASDDKTLSSIPLLIFQSHKVIFPKHTSDSSILVTANQNVSQDVIKVKRIHIKDVDLPASEELYRQITSDTLRVSLNLGRTDFQIEESEFKKLVAFTNKGDL
jgi:hypothetical protein